MENQLEIWWIHPKRDFSYFTWENRYFVKREKKTENIFSAVSSPRKPLTEIIYRYSIVQAENFAYFWTPGKDNFIKALGTDVNIKIVSLSLTDQKWAAWIQTKTEAIWSFSNHGNSNSVKIHRINPKCQFIHCSIYCHCPDSSCYTATSRITWQ